MKDTELLTAERFSSMRFELADFGRWVELVAGKVMSLEPPSDEHGTTVLNLSKALAAHIQSSGAENQGYACFGLGLVVARNPDTVRFPAVSWFVEGERFAEADKPFTEKTPALVIEVVARNRRRRCLSRRIKEYHDWGVELVWVADPLDKRIQVARRGRSIQQLAEHQLLSGAPVLKGFGIRVAELFVEPSWWRD